MATYHVAIRETPQGETIRLGTVERASFKEAKAQALMLRDFDVQREQEEMGRARGRTRLYVNGRRVG